MKINYKLFSLIILFTFIVFFTFYFNANKKSENNNIIIISIPKAGTWLLAKCLSSLINQKNLFHRLFKEGVLKNYSKQDFEFENYKNNAPEDDVHFFTPSIEVFDKCLNLKNNNEFLVSHLIYNKDYEDYLLKNNFKILFILRDPRDQLVSRVNYTFKKKKYYSGLQHLTFDELLFSFIGSIEQDCDDLLVSHLQYKNKPKQKYVSNIKEFYNLFLPWMKSKNCLVVHFENLVGLQGGSTLQTQIDEVKKIVNFLNLEISQKKINKVANNLFGGTLTFEQGQIGNWKKHFKDYHKNAFKKVAGQLLTDLGYENFK